VRSSPALYHRACANGLPIQKPSNSSHARQVSDGRLDPRLVRVAVGRLPPNYPLGENHTSDAFILKNLYSVAVRMVGSARPMTLIQWSTPPDVEDDYLHYQASIHFGPQSGVC
jgi:hypothetical protein